VYTECATHQVMYILFTLRSTVVHQYLLYSFCGSLVDHPPQLTHPSPTLIKYHTELEKDKCWTHIHPQDRHEASRKYHWHGKIFPNHYSHTINPKSLGLLYLFVESRDRNRSNVHLSMQSTDSFSRFPR